MPEGCKQRNAASNSFRGVLYKPTILLIQHKYNEREHDLTASFIRNADA